MTPAFAYGRSGKLYRYYVSSFLQQGQKRGPGDRHPRRISAAAIEAFVAEKLAAILEPNPEHRGTATSLLNAVIRLELQSGFVIASLPEHLCAKLRMQSQPDPHAHLEVHGDQVRIRWPYELAMRGKRTTIAGNGLSPKWQDPHLIRALRMAHAMIDDTSGDRTGHAIAAAPRTRYRRKLLCLAFLAPDIQKRILEGRQPPALTLAKILNSQMPLSWSAQRSWILSLR